MALQFKVSQDASKNEADIYVYGPIGETWTGEGVSGKSFLKEMRQVNQNATLNVHIFSPGGNAFDGKNIYSQLKTHKGPVNVYIEGLAASAASIIAMAGDKIYMPDNAMMMIHRPSTFAYGTAEDLKEAIEGLDIISKTSNAVYKERTGLPMSQVEELVNKTTWMTADEAIELGFADEKTDAVNVEERLKVIPTLGSVPEEILKQFFETTAQDADTIQIVTQETPVAAVPASSLTPQREQAMSETTETKVDVQAAIKEALEADRKAREAKEAEAAHVIKATEGATKFAARVNELVKVGKITPAMAEIHTEFYTREAADDVDAANLYAEKLLGELDKLESTVLAEQVATNAAATPVEEFKVDLSKFPAKSYNQQSVVLDAYAKHAVKQGTYKDYKEAVNALIGDDAKTMEGVYKAAGLTV